MAKYCIGDLHGRNDLFEKLLNKISFEVAQDTIYILGDIINENKGALPIIRKIMSHKETIHLLRGNHENFFLINNKLHHIMTDSYLRNKFGYIFPYITQAFREIKADIRRCIVSNNFDKYKETKKMKKWLNKHHTREKMYDAFHTLARMIDYDVEIYDELAERIDFIQYNNMFKMKPFVEELLQTSIEEYKMILEFFESCPSRAEFDYKGKSFILVHSPGYCNNNNMVHLPDMISKNKYVVFGHLPVAKIHRELNAKYDEKLNFDFNFREVLSYIDQLNNRYFNLDLTANAACALRLDDMEEFYVLKYKSNKKKNIVPPQKSVENRKKGFRKIHARFWFLEHQKTKLKPKPYDYKDDTEIYVNYRDHCMEYVFAVDRHKHMVYYQRVDLMDYIASQTISIHGLKVPASASHLNNILKEIKDDDEIVLKRKGMKKIAYDVRGWNESLQKFII